MNYRLKTLEVKMLELQKRAENASTREERLQILAEATVLQSMTSKLRKS